MNYKKITATIFFLMVVSFPNLFGQDKSSMPKFTIQLGGTYAYDATTGANPSSTFALGFARLIAKGSIMDNISYHIMTDVAGLSDANSGLTTRRSILKQAWVSYDYKKYAKLRVGQFKYPFGYDAYVSVTTWKFIIPSYATIGITKKLGSEGSQFRDIGAQFSGKVGASKDISIFYKAMVMNGNGPNLLDNNSEKDIVANLGVNLPFNIILAGSYFTGKTYDSESAGLDENAFSVYAAIKNKNFTAQAEYLSATSQYTAKDVSKSGYYVFGTYKLWQKLELGLRYDAYDKDIDTDDNSVSRVTVMAGFYFSKLNRIMINYGMRNSDSNPDLGNTVWALFQVVL